MNELSKDYPTVVDVPVAWGEMDAFEHVNNAVYFRWFESARIDYFVDVGLLESVESTGVGPILASTECRFRYPLTYPDTISVATRVSRIGADRFVMEYAVVGQTSGKLAANGSGLIVTFDYGAGVKATIPTGVRDRILELEAAFGRVPEPMSDGLK